MTFTPVAYYLFSLLFIYDYHLPKETPLPTGKYAVGTDTITFHYDSPTSDSIKKTRYVNVQVWYPAATNSSDSLSDYIIDTLLIAAMKTEQYLDIPEIIITSWKYIKTFAFWKAGLFDLEKKFPLVIFSHGFGMTKNNYSFMAIDLASHGYIVAAIDHPQSGLTILPDKTVSVFTPDLLGPDHKVELFCNDASYVINQLLAYSKFANNIDIDKIGMIGHSLGGAAAFNINNYDKRIKAVINLDGYLFGNAKETGIHIPFMAILQRPSLAIPDSMKIERRNEWKIIAEKSPVKSYIVNIKGLMHFDFSDLPFLIPDSLRIKNGGTLSAGRSNKILNALISGFFDEYLNHEIHQVENAINKNNEVSYELNKM